MSTSSRDNPLGHAATDFVFAGAAALATSVILLGQPVIQGTILAISCGVGAAIFRYVQNR